MPTMYRISRVGALALTLLAATADGAAAQINSEHLEIHGAVNAAYGRSSRIPVLGIPTWGTADYHNLMLQLRYHVNDRSQVVFQVLNRAVGISPLDAVLPDVAMHWGFYQYKADWGTVKVGRAPMPRGLFNEVKFVGTVLPLYRPAFEIYGEGRETVDGLVYSKWWRLDNGVALQANGFFGSDKIRTQVVTSTGTTIRAYDGDRLGGGQLWLQLPFYETRFGVYGARYDINATTPPGTASEVLLSAESKLPLATLRAEALQANGRNPQQDRQTVTGQVVAHAREWLDVVGEWTQTKGTIFQDAPLRNLDVTTTRDAALGMTVRLTTGGLVRAEYHDVRGYAFDRAVPFLSTVGTTTTVAPPSTTAYWLVSYAFSF